MGTIVRANQAGSSPVDMTRELDYARAINYATSLLASV